MDGGSRLAPLLALLAASALVFRDAPVLPGLDVLRVEAPVPLAGRRVGLITNHTGGTLDGTPALRLLRDELDVSVVALFSPEHGFSGTEAAGDEVPSSREPSTGIPVHSLYGATRAPTAEMLRGIDALVFDVQDVGVRFFTYASTMKLAMEAAAASGIEFVVLDRPNPQGGVRVEGPVLEAEFASFVGIEGLPLLHGMTVGELARFFRGTEPDLASLDLTVVPLRGWQRDMLWSDTGLPWRTPSPNLRTFESALAYPAFGLFEGVEFSEGRGIEETFEKIGAPWVDGGKLVDALTRRNLAGVRFHPATFVPRSISEAPRPRFRDETCHGIEIEILDARAFSPVLTGLAAIEDVRSQYPRSFRWVEREGRYWIDLLLGTDRPRRALDAGAGAVSILHAEHEALARFVRERQPYLLY
jgi:uncharacterized protein YbbC (DUF1343 family)